MTECFFRVLGYGSMNSRARGNELWIPAFAGMTDDGVGFPHARVMTDGGGGFPRARVNDGVFFSGVGVWVDEFPRARELWIPAFAGMTDGGGGFRGGFPRARVMTECFFRVLGYGSMNSRVRGNCGFPPSRE